MVQKVMVSYWLLVGSFGWSGEGWCLRHALNALCACKWT